MSEIRLIYDDLPGEPAIDTARSHAVLREVAAQRSPETLRIHRPGRVVAFGRHDTVSPGYAEAVEVSRREGFTPIERLAGGRAAVFHEHTIAFAWAIPTADPKPGVTERFERISAMMRDAMAATGVEARIGEVRGEYCPGRYSVNAHGTHKLMGVGQRLVAGAAHVGGVIVVDDLPLTRSILEHVYAALDLPWDPDTTGTMAMFAEVSWEKAAAAVIRRFAQEADLVSGTFTDTERELAASLSTQHLAASGSALDQ